MGREHKVTWLASDIPACSVASRCKAGRYLLQKEIITDPVCDVLLMRVRFVPSDMAANLKLYLFIEPQVGDQGRENDAWVAEYKSVSMLFAARDRNALAVATEPAFRQASAGYEGTSDGCSELRRHRGLPKSNRANKGNVALTAEIDTASAADVFTVSIGFGTDSSEVAQQARTGLLQQFEKTRAIFQQQWQQEHSNYCDISDLSGHALDIYRASTSVLEAHQSKRFPGAFVVSLSTDRTRM